MARSNYSARDEAIQHIEAALETGVRGGLREALRTAFSVARSERSAGVTEMEYRQLAPGAKLLDADRPGLLMRHGKRTGKVWIYRFSHPKTRKQIELQIGGYPDIGVAEARQIWSNLRSQRAEGKVPSTAGDTEPDSTTIGDLCQRFMVDYAYKVKRPSSRSEDQRLINRHLLPHYDLTPVDQFTRDTVMSILKPLHERAPREAEKLLALLKTLFRVATGNTRKILIESPWLRPDFPNPVASLALPNRDVKAHKPSRIELINYLRGVDGLRGDAGAILRTQIETFARIGEVVAMEWSELDLDAATPTWTLPGEKTKNGYEHVVMLAPVTVERLRQRQGSAATRYVFPAPRDPSRHVDSALPSKALSGNRVALGVSDRFTTHSTRHAGATWVMSEGGTRDIRDRLTNHLPPAGADRIYAGAKLDGPAREWTTRWCNHLAALEAENVVEFGSRDRKGPSA